MNLLILSLYPVTKLKEYKGPHDQVMENIGGGAVRATCKTPVRVSKNFHQLSQTVFHAFDLPFLMGKIF